nr:hypothetical protein [Angustibacter aerolatus]
MGTAANASVSGGTGKPGRQQGGGHHGRLPQRRQPHRHRGRGRRHDGQGRHRWRALRLGDRPQGGHQRLPGPSALLRHRCGHGDAAEGQRHHRDLAAGRDGAGRDALGRHHPARPAAGDRHGHHHAAHEGLEGWHHRADQPGRRPRPTRPLPCSRPVRWGCWPT